MTSIKGLIKKMSGFVLCSLAMVSVAYAYTPPTAYILKKMVNTRAAIKRIELTGRITDVKSQKKFDEVAQIDFASEKIRIYLYDETGKRIAQRDTSLSQVTPLGLAWIELGFDSNLDRVNSLLHKNGLSATKEQESPNLKRMGDRQVWEWGEEGLVDIAKDAFFLAGVRLPDQTSLVVDRYTAEGAIARFPKMVHFKKGDNELFTYEMTKFKSNAFNIQRTTDVQNSDDGNEWLNLVR